MSQFSHLITNLEIVPNLFLGPEYLNLPGLPPHLPLVLLSAIFYQCVYSFVAPLLWSVLEATDPNSSPRETIRSVYFFNNIVSVTQSFINSVLAVYLLSHPEFRDGLTPNEMALGYHKETARVLAVSMGYFVYHLIGTWMQIGHHGINMVLHAVCALFAVSLGYVSFRCLVQQIRNFISARSDEDIASSCFALHRHIPHLGTAESLPEFPKTLGSLGEKA